MKVRFDGASEAQIKFGSCDDPRKVLVIGQIYQVEGCEIHSWHTKLKLVGVDGKFNSVCFTEAK